MRVENALCWPGPGTADWNAGDTAWPEAARGLWVPEGITLVFKCVSGRCVTP